MKTGRQVAVFLLLFLFSCVLGSRLYFWQVVRHSSLTTMAQNEHVREEQIPARRGSIYDAAGNVLATNEAVDAVYAARKQIDDPGKTAEALAPLLAMPQATVLARITDPNLEFVRLKTWVTSDVSKQIRTARLGGVFLEPTTRRVYSQGPLASQDLGFVNQDGEGQYGLEEAYNEILSGTPGHLTAEVDTSGRPINFSTPRDQAPARDGADVMTSIDSTLQYMAERELKAAVEAHKSTGGTILIMDPKTGQILANASVPTFDPNNYSQTPPEAFANPSVSRMYEPGSTFKMFTMAAGLAEHAVEPTTSVVDTGALSLAGIRITNWDGKGHSPENMTQVLQYSSNVGAATVGWRVGAPKFYPRMQSFGFGDKTGVDLAGEISGQMTQPGDRNWTPSNLVTNSFGQGIAVTPLQLVTAASAVANGGMLVKPHAVTAVRDSAGLHPVPTTEVRRVLEPAVAATLTDMLVNSAKVGEAYAAVVPGFKIAAKTGTAQIASPQGGYLEGKFIASLLGYAPADDPKFVMLVKIDEPQGVPFGSEVAAPVWQTLARQLFVHFKIEPTDPAALEKSFVQPTPVATAAAKPAAAPNQATPARPTTASPQPSPQRSGR